MDKTQETARALSAQAGVPLPDQEDVDGNLSYETRVKAARYDFLRNQLAYVAVHPHYRDLPMGQRTGWTIRMLCGNDVSFDAAVDAAIAKATT